MGSLLDDLIQTTLPGKEEPKLKPETVDLNIIIDEALAMTIGQIREKSIALGVDIPDDLPQLTADRDALLQILIHLLQNATSASPAEGEIALSASTHPGTDGSEDGQDVVMIRVSDTGGGIPADELPRVFSRLYRADNALIQGVGDTGVGLSIVKTLVEAHGGRVWVDSEMGHGSTFSIILPVSSNYLQMPAQRGVAK
jgi:signal transduction histidine kinase